ncbi:MAG TPA: transporter [Candidatus Babeliales bacterium]|nr:transporter [Candidatus Babeliales bacterium]
MKLIYFCFIFLFLTTFINGYRLPSLGLGYTNILDGGPTRPYPGGYWQQWIQYYTTQRFLDARGKALNNLSSPHFRGFATVTEFIYQFDYQLPLGGMPGFVLALPLTLYSKIEKNALDIQSSGPGFGNLYLSAYSQWNAIQLRGRQFFIHRLEVDFSIPMGKNKLPEKQINPSDSFFYCGANWAATLYISSTWNISWALHYIWNAHNEKINTQAGDVIYCNYSIAHELFSNFYLAAVGYALQQIHNDHVDGISVSNSRERVFGVGPGVAYFLSKDTVFFSYLYLEAGARNRTQGTNFISRLIMHF